MGEKGIAKAIIIDVYTEMFLFYRNVERWFWRKPMVPCAGG